MRELLSSSECGMPTNLSVDLIHRLERKTHLSLFLHLKQIEARGGRSDPHCRPLWCLHHLVYGSLSSFLVYALPDLSVLLQSLPETEVALECLPAWYGLEGFNLEHSLLRGQTIALCERLRHRVVSSLLVGGLPHDIGTQVTADAPVELDMLSLTLR